MEMMDITSLYTKSETPYAVGEKVVDVWKNPEEKWSDAINKKQYKIYPPFIVTHEDLIEKFKDN